LGRPYKELRALRTLLFRDSEQVLGSPELDSLSLSTVLHVLISRAPSELLSPHVKAGRSLTKYSEWLDEHNDEDVWRVIKGSLDAYVQKVRSRGDTQLHPIYPIFDSVAAYYLQETRQDAPSLERETDK